MKTPYPKPGPIGGRLIREVIRLLKETGVSLPLSSHILCACSAGSDSLALAHLLAKYGRRVGSADRLRLLHVNHGWRGAESDADAEHVRRLAREWGVPFTVVRLKPGSTTGKGESWEAAARKRRKRIFARQAFKRGAVVLTAHHADDLAETLLWRLLTGQAGSHGAGILVRDGVELRPLLRVRKSMLQAYLREEGIEWREDRTNREERFLRARMRVGLMPEIERIFPRAIEHLVETALALQKGLKGGRAAHLESAAALRGLFSAAGVEVRAAQWKLFGEASFTRGARIDMGPREFHLSNGWRLRREKATGSIAERWMLEKTRRDPKS